MFGIVKNKILLIILVLSAGICFVSCREDSERGEKPSEQAGKPTIYVVNYPLQYFAERIEKDLVDVKFPAPEDEDPAYWKPDASCIEAYQKADLILLNGATYAKWIPMISLPTSKMVDTSESFKKQYIELEEAITHAHGPEGAHAHGGIAFTTWLDQKLAIQQAESVKRELAKLLPDKTDVIEQNYAALKSDLESLDRSLEELTKNYSSEPLLGSHPVYQYLARGYGLNMMSVHWEPEQMPEESQWRELDGLLQTHAAKWMIWEGPPGGDVVEKLRERGVNSVVFSPCGNVPEQGDYLSVMRENIERLKIVFQQQ
ncbi:MAG: metal ABC transporter substrate-binding protein [Planctomycetota bacterium]|jgi:zinc transport system substrate-binding protein